MSDEAKSTLSTIVFWMSSVVIVALGVNLVMVTSEAEDTVLRVVIKGQVFPPTIGTITTSLSSGGPDLQTLTMNEGTPITIHVYGTATDNTGCYDIDRPSDYSVKIFRSGGNRDCSDTYHSCYTPVPVPENLSGCILSGGDVNIDFDFSVQLQHSADATDTGIYKDENWVASVKVTDESEGASVTAQDTFEIATLRAIRVTSNINYGSLKWGALSDEAKLTVINTGSDTIDYKVRVNGDMVCTKGTIPAESVHFSRTPTFDYPSAKSFTATDQVVGARIPKSSTPRGTIELPEDPLYLKLKVPLYGTEGKCGNTIFFTADAPP